jgi:hypothetical protein
MLIFFHFFSQNWKNMAKIDEKRDLFLTKIGEN